MTMLMLYIHYMFFVINARAIHSAMSTIVNSYSRVMDIDQ
uniref:Uncharacterized protein n=1 Tax=Rhizophora mucronata TaxID=61149 RepID=A0A2P2Q599_RHIMU